MILSRLGRCTRLRLSCEAVLLVVLLGLWIIDGGGLDPTGAAPAGYDVHEQARPVEKM